MATENVNATPSDSDRLRRARLIFEEIANLANRIDQHCYYSHAELISGTWEEANPHKIELELIALRESICRLGHLADFGSHEIDGAVVRGETREWLMPPVYPGN